MSAWYEDDQIALHHGDALRIAKSLPDRSVDCIVTSPPYFGLRDYGQEGQYGLEETPAEYVENLRKVFAALWDVLLPGGSLWLNLGDSYGKRKQLLGIPWRVAFALQDDGWILRSDVIWNKTNAMPESVRDRLARRHEHIFLLTKSPRYHFDLDPIRENKVSPQSGRAASFARGTKETLAPYQGYTQHREGRTDGKTDKGKNPGDVWAFASRGFKAAHFAVFPPELPRRCILAGSPANGVILDPFSGSGTTGMVALELGRRYVGIDVSAEYLQLSIESRLHNRVINLEEPA